MKREHQSEHGRRDAGDDSLPVPLDALPDAPEPRIDAMWRNIAEARHAARRRRWITRAALVSAAAALILAVLRVAPLKPAPDVPTVATGAPMGSPGEYEATVKALEAAIGPHWASLPASTAAPLKRSLAEVRAALSAVDRELLENPDSRGLIVMQARYRWVYWDLLRRAILVASGTPQEVRPEERRRQS